MALFFAVTLFVSAFLLFLVQPMVGKMVLPLLGGAPAAWATCMVFFQALLLAGYAYAHAAVRRLGSRRQAVVHLALLTLPLIALGLTALLIGSPIRAYRALAPQGQELPFVGAIALLTAAIGLPFFVVATSAPLLQRWFADTDHPAAGDPYFLYAASNFGSLLALVAYPFVVEPRFTLATQGWLWSAGYLLLVGLTAGCAWRVRYAQSREASGGRQAPGSSTEYQMPDGPSSPSPINRLRWLVLAFVPSSLLLSVTQVITTDIAPVPGLWVLPLAIYLLTFIIAFGRSPGWLHKTVELFAPLGILALLFLNLSEIHKPESLGMLLAIHLTVFFLVALNCHLDLARRRPSADRLTEYFLWISLGGVLGGLFNSLIAPLLFNDLFEYQLVLIAACFLQPAAASITGPNRWLINVAAALAVAGVAWGLFCFPTDKLPLVRSLPWPTSAKPFYRWVNFFPIQVWRSYVPFAVPLFVSYWWIDRPARFGLCVAAAWLTLTAANRIDARHDERVLHRGRSFFGVLAVHEDFDKPDGDAIRLPDGTEPIFHRLVHGTTLHGLQQWDPPANDPLTYYHRTGPIGQLFTAAPPAVTHGRFAFVGLGSGTLAAYGQPGQSITFYEIDPAVRRIAEDRQYFTYLSDCKAKVDVVMGDARLQLESHAKHGEYSLIVVDAFSSDAIPIHLLTEEAVQLYLDKLTDDGVIALHLSNRFLDLEVVVARLVQELRAREPNLTALRQFDGRDRFDPQADKSPDNYIPGKRTSQWMVLARDGRHLAALKSLPPTMTIDGRQVTLSRWKDLSQVRRGPLWTDDFSNLTQILNWQYILPWLDE